MPNRITKKGAAQASSALDRIATLIQSEYAALGLPKKVADDFAERCDLVSDRIELTAGLERDEDGNLKNANFDPSEIGREDGGPLEGDSDEAYMRGEFSQQESRELREEVEGGNFAAPGLSPQPARAGIQANFNGLVAALKSTNLTGPHSEKVAKALALAADIVKSAGEDEDADEGDDEHKGGKKASHGFDIYA